MDDIPPKRHSITVISFKNNHFYDNYDKQKNASCIKTLGMVEL